MFFSSLQIKVCAYITKFKGKLSWRRALHQNKNDLRANQLKKETKHLKYSLVIKEDQLLWNSGKKIIF